MSLLQEYELLRRVPFFAEIEPARLKLLAFMSERVGFDPGKALCRQGDPADAAYLIIEGEADVLVDTPTGPLVLATLGANDIVGEMAILGDVPRTATVQATTRIVALRSWLLVSSSRCASSRMIDTAIVGNSRTIRMNGSLAMRSATMRVFACTVAVRGTSPRIAISPTMSLAPSVAKTNGPVGVSTSTSASPSMIR